MSPRESLERAASGGAIALEPPRVHTDFFFHFFPPPFKIGRFHTHFHVFKRNPRHSKDVTRKPLDLEIQMF